MRKKWADGLECRAGRNLFFSRRRRSASGCGYTWREKGALHLWKRWDYLPPVRWSFGGRSNRDRRDWFFPTIQQHAGALWRAYSIWDSVAGLSAEECRLPHGTRVQHHWFRWRAIRRAVSGTGTKSEPNNCRKWTSKGLLSRRGDVKEFTSAKKPEVDNLRVVEVTGYDYCGCCGTHVARTGEIG